MAMTSEQQKQLRQLRRLAKELQWSVERYASSNHVLVRLKNSSGVMWPSPGGADDHLRGRVRGQSAGLVARALGYAEEYVSFTRGLLPHEEATFLLGGRAAVERNRRSRG